MDLRLSSVIILTKSLLSSSNSQTFKRSLVYFVFSACYKLSLLSHSVQPIAPVVAIFLRSKSFASKQGKQDSSRCNSGGCIPAHKCQQSRTDILDLDLAMIFTLFILRTTLHSVLEKVLTHLKL